MAKKIQLQDANGNVLHPLTLGECVTMDNGENLDTLMSKSQMFTPTITQDKSMFKVGTGVNVDYSANVKDGAYESLVFKGKSLVNLLNYSFPSRTNWHDNAGANSYIRTGQSISMLKPNTDYLMWFEGEKTIVQILALSTVFTKAYFELTGKSLVKVRTVNGELPANFTIHFKSSVGGSLTDNEKASVKLMLIEYQEGMESWEIPYFDGIGYAKMPILRNVGKNLFDVSKTLCHVGDGVLGETTTGTLYFYSIFTGQAGGSAKRSDVSKLMKLCKGNYSFSGSVNKGNLVLYVYDLNGDYLSQSIFINNTLTITQDVYVDILVPSPMEFDISNIQLEESSSATTYEDHKTNILCTSEEIVLREVNGVQDTYNPLTGEYVQRIGEAILDGSSDENWGRNTTLSSNTETSFFTLSVDKVKRTMGTITKKCDKMTANPDYAHVQDIEGIHQVVDNQLSVRILKNRLSSDTVEGLKQWLSQNPITVQYQLTEPVTTIVKSSTMTPFAYQNGHVIVESGFEGQSLLPEIEYSVVTGRTGQVTQNTKVLRQQEQQITSLEELLLTQVVQMEYERTLLQFDYELQMMMLG